MTEVPNKPDLVCRKLFAKLESCRQAVQHGPAGSGHWFQSETYAVIAGHGEEEAKGIVEQPPSVSPNVPVQGPGVNYKTASPQCCSLGNRLHCVIDL
jgi:hypothetical protein